jgi:acyl-CoA synthetase (NDP forming)
VISASPEAEVDALFRQAGIVRVDTVDELFDAALLVDRAPIPGGRRVVIVSNTTGPAVLAADACAGVQLELAALHPQTRGAIGQVAPPGVATTNPIDLGAEAIPPVFEAAITTVLTDPGVDAVVVVCMATPAAASHEVTRTLGRVTQAVDKPVVVCLLAWPEPLARLPGGAPNYVSPERAVRALARSVDYAAWRRRDPGIVPDYEGVQVGRAEAARVLDADGVPCLPVRVADSPASVAEAAAAVGYPVVLKSVGVDAVHKSDVGGVRLDVRTAADVEAAYLDLRAQLGDAAATVVVQPLAPTGVEVVIALTEDPLFGRLVAAGMAGPEAELLGDRAYRLLPVTDVDAAELVRSLRTSPLLFGYRGRPRSTSPHSRTLSCASPNWPTTSRRSPRSSSTRSSSLPTARSRSTHESWSRPANLHPAFAMTRGRRW